MSLIVVAYIRRLHVSDIFHCKGLLSLGLYHKTSLLTDFCAGDLSLTWSTLRKDFKRSVSTTKKTKTSVRLSGFKVRVSNS